MDTIDKIRKKKSIEHKIKQNQFIGITTMFKSLYTSAIETYTKKDVHIDFFIKIIDLFFSFFIYLFPIVVFLTMPLSIPVIWAIYNIRAFFTRIKLKNLQRAYE